MTQIASTLTIPVYSQPHFLHTTLHALVKNSHYKHRIIIIWSDSERIGPPAGARHANVTDFESDPDLVGTDCVYSSVRDFLNTHAVWLARHDIEALDVTEQCIEFREQYATGEVYPGKSGVPEGGVDTAFKNNLGLRLTDTEWTIPNWDCDFYPAPGWDKPIFDYALRAKHTREVLIPMHVQPHLTDAATAASWDVWRDSPPISCHRLAMPVTTRNAGGTIVGSAADFDAFAIRSSRPGRIIREPAGARAQLHWVPWILRTDELRMVGGFNYQGGGYDLEFDNRLARFGFTKIGFCDSFVAHKLFPPVTCDA